MFRLKQYFITMLSVIFMGLVCNAQAVEQATEFKLKPVPEVSLKQDYFPGDRPTHHVVYMLNKSDVAYQHSILNSIKAMLSMYGGNVEIAIVFIGPGIHLVTKKPRKKVNTENYNRVKSFAKDYGVRMIACGNTMKTLGLEDKDMIPSAEYVKVGAAALMVLQSKGFSYISW